MFLILKIRLFLLFYCDNVPSLLKKTKNLFCKRFQEAKFCYTI